MIKLGSRLRIFWGNQHLGDEYDMYGLAVLAAPNTYFAMTFIGVARQIPVRTADFVNSCPKESK